MDILPALAQGRLCLAVIHPAMGHAWLMEPMASLAERGPIQVIDGGNHFNAYRLAKAIGGHGLDPTPVLRQVFVSRSFACHQLAACLSLVTSRPLPLIVLDFLATFQDESVPLHERRKLFNVCLWRLRQISRTGPILITAKANTEFIGPLAENCDQILQTELKPLPATLPLFQDR